MKSTRLLKLFFYPLVSLSLLSVAFAFLIVTESGFRLMLRTGDYLAGSLFSVGQIQGRFVSNWQLQGVKVVVDDGVDIAVEELRFNWQPWALTDKELLVQNLKIEGLVLRLADSGAVESDVTPIVLPDIFLPIGIRVKDLLIKDAEIFFPGDPAPFTVNEMAFSGALHGNELTVGRLHLNTPDYAGDLQGNVEFNGTWPLGFSGSWQVTDPGIGDLSGSVEAEGDLKKISITVNLATPARAEVHGQVTGLLDELHWQATGRTEPFQLGDIQVDLPIDGTLTVVEASGTIKTYSGTLGADIQYDGYPRIQASAEVQGDYSGLTVHSLSLLHDEARLTTRGKIRWVGGFSWQVELESEKLDPAPFVPDWPGRINALLSSRGTWEDNTWTADVNIQRLQGDLRGFPLTGSGRAELDSSTLILDDIQLQSGSSYLQVSGRANNELEFVLRAGFDDLATLVPEGSGVFQLQGSITGSREQPRLALTMTGSDLSVDEYSVESLQGNVMVDLAGEGSTEADIEAEGIGLKGETISKARLQVQGNLAKHQAELSITGSPGSVHLAAAGAFIDHHWQGMVSELLLQSNQFGDWKIQDSVSLQLSKKQAEISRLTLVQDNVQVSLAGEWQQEKGWQVYGAVDDFSLHLLEEWDLLTTKLEGVLTASVEATGQGGVPGQLEFKAAVPDISMSSKDEEGGTRVFHWTGNSVQADLLDGNAQLTAQTLFQDGSTADLDLAVTNCCDFTRPEEMLLDGNLKLHFKDLGPLAPLSGYMVNGKGGFAGSLALQGTVAEPTLQGAMALQDGEIEIPDAGIAVQELKLTVDGDSSAGNVRLSISSDGSKLNAEGVVKQDAEKQWQADFTVKGENFQAVNLTEYQAFVSPDLSLIYGPSGTFLSGTVTVPKARVAPVGFQSSVSSSRDVVVLDTDGKEEKKGLPLSLDIQVVMGDEVQVDAFGVKGYLDGRLKIEQKPGRGMTGIGSLNFRDGTFVYKSAHLKIDRGIVLYQGGPIDDPGLDVLATKQLGDKEVGVNLTGNVSRLELKLFSNPSMEESDIIASLLAGRDVSGSGDQENSALGAAVGIGIGAGGDYLGNITEETGFDVSLAGGEEVSDVSLVIGKEIYKDLYISYGKGLTNSTGAFKARYELKYGFSVETETTSEASGSDLFWSLER